ncbi:MAG: helix-turn-helix domain-containing protein [Planctomycetaceae bacterium]|nr:helix-turn-helix domain-containing protein [Planctomycetaceae bacterium]
MTQGNERAESPGRSIEQLLDSTGWSQNDLAEIMGRPVQTINQIIAGTKSITMATARGLAAAFGAEHGTAEDWLRRQLEHQIAVESVNVEDCPEVARRAKLHSQVPLREMVKRGWVAKCSSVDETERQVAQFFGVVSVEAIVPPKFCARAKVSVPAQNVWAQRAWQLATELPQLAKYSEKKLRGAVAGLRECFGDPAKTVEVLELIARAGVRLVVVQHLTKTRIDGAAFWLKPKTQPVIALSMRFGRIDYFAFTLLHEVHHILEQHEAVLDTEMLAANGELSEQELSANRWAADVLVPAQSMNDFLQATKGSPSRVAIERFAASIGIHAGIVVGQLQNRGVVGYSSHRDLLVDVRDPLLAQRDLLQSRGVAAFDGWLNQKEDE